jgi:glutathione S-transferase
MIVHGIPGSPYVRAVLLTLEEKGAAYELAAMAFGTLKQQPHLSRHPFGRIPAFEHDGWMLYETQAIMRYVDAVVPGPAAATGRAARGGADEPGDGHHRLVCYAAGLDADHAQPRRGAARQPAGRRGRDCQAIPNARICVAEIGRSLDGHPWMAGDALSLAHLLLAPHLSMFVQAPEGAQLQEHDNLRGWLERIEARPSMQATTWDSLLERVAAAV